MNDIRVVAFDCDGVLFDTEQANRVYYDYFLKHFGRPGMDSEQLRYVHAHTFHEALAHLFPEEEARQAAMELRKGLDYGDFIKHLTIEPTLTRVLPRLRQKVNTAIATNRMDTMHRLLREFGIADQFDLVVTSLDVANPKPFPDPLLKILSHFNVNAHQMLFVGDSGVDEQTARAAGVPFVAFRNPSLAALRHIDSLAALEPLIGI
jgi:HAD superfamily hydrolase (TIGR01509 family)